MAFIGKQPTPSPLTASDITDGIITNAKLAQDIISAETELATAPADTDEFLISDAGTLKRIDASLVGGGGKILQVVSTTKTDVFTMESSTYADVTGFSVSITPTSSSNKIFIMMTGVFGKSTADNFSYKLLRGSTDLMENVLDPGTDTNNADTFALTFLDSPSTTSATTYKMQIKNDGGGRVTVNRRNVNSTDRGDSTITAFEVSA